MKKIIREIATGIFLLIFLLCSYFVYVWKASVSEIKFLCSSFVAGQPIEEVISSVRSSKYSKHLESYDKKENKSHILIHSPSNIGRHLCWVEHTKGKVIKAAHSLMD